MRCTAAPSRCVARPARSARRGNGRLPPGRPGSAGRRSPPRCVRDAETALAALATSVTRAAAERDAVASARTASEAELLEVRARVRAATGELDRLTDEVHRDEVARAEQRLPDRGAGGPRGRGVRRRPAHAARRVRAGRAGAADPGAGRRGRGGGGARARSGALRPRRPGAPRGQGRARPRHARQGQPARAGGVRGAGGAARIPRHPARGPQDHPARPAHRRPRGRRAHPRRVRRRLRRRRPGVRGGLRRRSSPAAPAGWCSPSPTTC